MYNSGGVLIFNTAQAFNREAFSRGIWFELTRIVVSRLFITKEFSTVDRDLLTRPAIIGIFESCLVICLSSGWENISGFKLRKTLYSFPLSFSVSKVLLVAHLSVRNLVDVKILYLV